MAARKSPTLRRKLRELGPQIEKLSADGRTWEEIASFVNEGSGPKHSTEAIRKAWGRLNDCPARKPTSPHQRPLQVGLTERLAYNPGSSRSFVSYFNDDKRHPTGIAATDETGSCGQITIVGPDGGSATATCAMLAISLHAALRSKPLTIIDADPVLRSAARWLAPAFTVEFTDISEILAANIVDEARTRGDVLLRFGPASMLCGESINMIELIISLATIYKIKILFAHALCESNRDLESYIFRSFAFIKPQRNHVLFCSSIISDEMKDLQKIILFSIVELPYELEAHLDVMSGINPVDIFSLICFESSIEDKILEFLLNMATLVCSKPWGELFGHIIGNEGPLFTILSNTINERYGAHKDSQKQETEKNVSADENNSSQAESSITKIDEGFLFKSNPADPGVLLTVKGAPFAPEPYVISLNADDPASSPQVNTAAGTSADVRT